MMDRAVLLLDRYALEPVWKSLRDVLLPEALSPDPRRISLHRQRTTAQVRQHERGDRFVVRRQLALGDPIVREEHLLRMRDHAVSRMTSRAALSCRTRSRRGWRS